MTPQITLQLSYAAGLIAATILVHAVMIIIARTLFFRRPEKDGPFTVISDTVRLVVIAVWMMLAHGVAIAMWAWLYQYTGMNPAFEEALYFALTTYTTLGFGDIVPPQDWRLLTGLSSANGLLQFGLSAAVLVDATERLRQGRR